MKYFPAGGVLEIYLSPVIPYAGYSNLQIQLVFMLPDFLLHLEGVHNPAAH